MEWLQTLLDNSTTPALTASLLGLLTALSPCPLATNIAAVGFIGRQIGDRRRVFRNGLLYTLGRIVAYTALGMALIPLLREGSSLFGIQRFIGRYGALLVGPALLLCGALVGILKLHPARVALGAAATAGAALLAHLRIDDAALAPLVPTIVAVAALSHALLRDERSEENREWALASWGFAKQILPLLAIGVATAGFLLGSTHDGTSVAGIVPDAWVAWAVGGDSLRSNFFASFTGAFMYFATLTEVPIIQGLMASGMGKGPALALLLAGPSLSLPNMLVIRGVLGTKKTAVYVALVVAMATLAGYVYGNLL